MLELIADTEELYSALQIQLEGIQKFKLTDTCLIVLKEDTIYMQTSSATVLHTKVKITVAEDSEVTDEAVSNIELVVRLSKLINVLSGADKTTRLILSSSGITLSSKGRTVNLPSLDIKLTLFSRDEKEEKVDSINPALLVGEIRFLLSTLSVSKSLGKVHNFDFTETCARVCYPTANFQYKAKHKMNLSIAPDTARFLVSALGKTDSLKIWDSPSYTALQGKNFKVYFTKEDFIKVDVDAKLRAMQHITTIDNKQIRAWIKVLLQSTPRDSLYITIRDQAINLTLQSDSCGASLEEGDCTTDILLRLFLPLEIANTLFLNFEGKIKIWKGVNVYGFSDDRVTALFTSL